MSDQVEAQVPRDDETYEPPLTDWTLRPFARFASPFPLAIAATLGFVALSQLVRLVLGEPHPGPLWRDPFLWLDLLNAVLYTYIPTTLWLLRRARLRDLRALRPALREGVSYRELVDGALSVPARRLGRAGAVGAVLLGVLPLVDPAFWEGPPPPGASLLMIFFVLRMALSGWLSGRAVATEVAAITAFARIGARHVRVDLHDLRPFEVFARVGQRSAFAWVLVSSLVSLFWLGPGAGTLNAFIVGSILAAVSLAYFVCVFGPHRVIGAARRDALRNVEARIAGAGSALLDGSASPASPRLADLVAYHGYLERVREWPLGAPALARAALIVALAVGSWLGGALVERVVDRLFG